MVEPEPGTRADAWSGLGLGWTMTVELLAAILVWGGIGWLVDTYVLASTPWAMVAGFLLGTALGIYLVYVRAREYERAAEAAREAARDW